MNIKKVKVERITEANFKPFGKIISLPRKHNASPGKNLWRVIVRQPHAGWRIAYLVVRDSSVLRLERHPGSLESFEPVAGQGVLFVALRKVPSDIRAFYLDKSVILKKGLWHGIVTCRPECDIKITENSAVKSVYWRLGFRCAPRGRP